jgi:hypothetical protein
MAWFKKNRLIFFGSFVILSLFLNLSYTNGIDWTNYQFSYEYDIFQTRGIEYGYTVLQLLFKTLGFNFEIFKFIILTINLFIIHKFVFKYSNRPMFSMLILFQTYLLGNFFEPAIRQIQVVVILLIAAKYLISNENKKYIFCILLGSLFHQSALVLLILPYVIKKITFLRISIVTIILILAPTLVLGFVSKITNIRIFSDYSFYLNSTFLEGIEFRVFNIFKAVIYLLPMFFLRNYKKDDKTVNLFRNMSYLFILSYFMQFGFLLFYRFNHYFIIYYVIYISKLFKMIKPIWIRRLIFTFYVSIHLVSLVRGISYYKDIDSMKYYPYTNYVVEYLKGDLYDEPINKINHRINSRINDMYGN